MIIFTRQIAGTLRYGRAYHGAIFDGEKFLIIGGYANKHGPVKSEVCTLKGSTMSCFSHSEALDGYNNYPELFIVPKDFGKDASKC